MPTYEYACRDCEEHLEVVQSFADDPLETCGACGGRLRKVFSAAGIIFKGSGYYVTDTRAERQGNGSGSSGSDKSSETSGGDSASSGGDSSGSGGDSSAGSSDSGSAEAKSA